MLVTNPFIKDIRFYQDSYKYSLIKPYDLLWLFDLNTKNIYVENIISIKSKCYLETSTFIIELRSDNSFVRYFDKNEKVIRALTVIRHYALVKQSYNCLFAIKPFDYEDKSKQLFYKMCSFSKTTGVY